MQIVNVQKTFYTIGDFIAWHRAGTLVLNPAFQRRSVWKVGTKSFLIDTVAKGLPIPIIFLRDKGIDLKTLQAVREVIDGQQRLRTLIGFIDPKSLKDFDPARDGFTVSKTHNKDLANRQFGELNPEMQRQLLEYQFDVHVFPSQMDDRDVVDMFRRMNSTNYALNAQELRNARYTGEFKTSVYGLATEQLHRWRNWRTFDADDIARMHEVELTVELVLLMIQGKISGKSKPGLDRPFRIYEEEYPGRNEVEKRFRHVMDVLEERLDSALMRSPLSRRTILYSLYCYIYDQAFGLTTSVLKEAQPRPITVDMISRVKLVGERIASGNAPKAVMEATTRRTTHPKERSTIFEYFSSCV